LNVWANALTTVENGLDTAASGRIREEWVVVWRGQRVRKESVETVDTGYASFDEEDEGQFSCQKGVIDLKAGGSFLLISKDLVNVEAFACIVIYL